MEDDSFYTQLCAQGDTKAFGELYDRYIDKIYRFIYYKIFVKEIAEDLTSDVFTKAFEKIKSFDPKKGPFSAWIYRIARNAVIDHYRTRKTTIPIEDIFETGEENRTPQELDAVAELAKVTEYLKTLSAKQREIITLRIWDERSYKEIAEIVGSTESGVKMAFSRSIRDLRDTCGPIALLLLMELGRAKALPFHILS